MRLENVCRLGFTDGEIRLQGQKGHGNFKSYVVSRELKEKT